MTWPTCRQPAVCVSHSVEDVCEALEVQLPVGERAHLPAPVQRPLLAHRYFAGLEDVPVVRAGHAAEVGRAAALEELLQRWGGGDIARGGGDSGGGWRGGGRACHEGPQGGRGGRATASAKEINDTVCYLEHRRTAVGAGCRMQV
jgi:hypothetical protein